MNTGHDQAPANQRNAMGTVGLILSCVGLVPCLCLLALPGLVVSVLALQKQPRTAATLGTVLGAIGFLLTPLWFALALPALSSMRESARTQTAQSHVNLLKLESEHHNNTNEAWPKSMDELDSKEVMIRKDPWGNDVRFQGNGMTPPTISSAGPDGLHGTADDITPKGSYR